MKKLQKYSDGFKQSGVLKLLNRGNRTAQEIADKHGIHQSTLYDWRDKFANVSSMKKQSNNQS